MKEYKITEQQRLELIAMLYRIAGANEIATWFVTQLPQQLIVEEVKEPETK